MNNPATEAIEEIREASRLPNRTSKALNEDSQTPSDLNAIAKRDAVYTKGEKDGTA